MRFSRFLAFPAACFVEATARIPRFIHRFRPERCRRWGRNGEGGAECPYLMGELASSWTRGLQNSSQDPKRIQVAVTLKHFVANSVESTIGWSAREADGYWTRHNISVNISNYTLSDAYFPAFRAAISNAGARGVMCSCAYGCG